MYQVAEKNTDCRKPFKKPLADVVRRNVPTAVTSLKVAPLPMRRKPEGWHDLRLEIIGTHIRAYMNGDLRAQHPADVQDSGGCGVIHGVSALSS
jgi:hypothetical protein